MDLKLGDESPKDKCTSNQSGNEAGDIRVRNIHGETVGKRSKRYLITADESNTDDLNGYDHVQNGDLFASSDNVSSINISSTNRPTNKMSGKPKEVKKTSNYERLLLSGGKELKEESGSDYEKLALPNGRTGNRRRSQDASRKSSDASESAKSADTSEKSITIPVDGNLMPFSVDDMAGFFRAMNVDELIVQRLQRKKLDGKKFSKLKDSVLEDIGIKNPIICYFRDRSKKDRLNFML